jgi:hypothetical protein
MLTPEQVSELHRLHFVEKWPARKIARHMHIGRRTIAKRTSKMVIADPLNEPEAHALARRKERGPICSLGFPVQ